MYICLYMEKVICLEICVCICACICASVYVQLRMCMYLYIPAHKSKSIYVCICIYIVTYMSVDICNYVTDNVFYCPVEVDFCSLLFQTTDISCDGRGTSDLVSVPHFQLQMDHYRQRSTENPDICSSHECTHLLENSLPSCSGNWLKMSSMKISMR